ncbi:3-hydroxyacyl-thioester dehydratase HtdZ [soil metagenome]|jgi:acyl dehydratase
MSNTETDRTITTVEDLKTLIGQELSVGQWVEITQERVNQFADVTGDHQYIHVDPERAKNTFFGGTIAHGYLTLSLLPLLGKDRTGIRVDLGGKMAVNYGVDRVRFPAPVPVGKRVRMRSKLLAVEEIGDSAVQMKYQQTVEVEGQEKPGCVAETLSRIYF